MSLFFFFFGSFPHFFQVLKYSISFLFLRFSLSVYLFFLYRFYCLFSASLTYPFSFHSYSLFYLHFWVLLISLFLRFLHFFSYSMIFFIFIIFNIFPAFPYLIPRASHIFFPLMHTTNLCFLFFLLFSFMYPLKYFWWWEFKEVKNALSFFLLQCNFW